ncbi:MAG: ABC-three component system protein [Niveispirillum sp.]|uniref:ABC-three component system protein n=1 Tax=Niveispirillum sp. TaxID=1917217 RepID=UPI003BA42BD7
MNEFDWEWQRLRAESEFKDLEGDAFETRFQSIAKSLWQEDFTPTIPMGVRGDLKCDGFRASTGTVYQCYGPRYGQANVDGALAKIDADFRGAKAHWGPRLREWKFVVNLYRDKLPSELVLKIEQLAEELEVPAGPLTRSDILDLIKGLPAEERVRLYGRAPMATDMARITYANLGRALTLIRRAIATDPNEPVPLSADLVTKMTFNALSNATRHFLSIGQTGVAKVEEYLHDQPDPEEPERMAQGFKARYAECVTAGLEPDQTFKEMVVFAGGVTGDAERDTAALAIVTRFFVTCQIFEIPVMGVAP